MRVFGTALLALMVTASVDLQDGAAQEVVAPGDIALDVDDPSSTETDVATRYPEIKTAFDKFAQRQFEEAESLLKQAMEKNPELPPAGVIMGTWYFKAQNPGAARTAFERAVRDNPNDPEAYVVFGDNAIQQRRLTDAILLYEKGAAVCDSYEANPERKKNMMIRAQNGIAAVAEAREMWAESEQALRKVLAADAQNAVAMTRLGRVLFKQGREQEAYDTFKALYELDPTKMVRYEINMARLYQQDGKEANASKLIERALERDAENLLTHLAAAQWALETDKIDLASTTAEKAVQLDGESVQVRLLEGLIARIKGDYPAAEAAFRKAHSLSPSSAVVLNQLAIVLAGQDDPDKQKQAFEFAQMGTRLIEDPNQPVAREAAVTLAWVLMRLDRKDAAQQQLQKALTSGPVGPDAAFFAADILHAVGKSDAAIQLLENAVENGRGVFPSKGSAEALLRKIRGQ